MSSAAPLNESVTLNSGHNMPVLGLGTWMSAPGEVGAAVKHALKVGYRHIDCAAVYGNETEVGQALKEAMQELNLKREEVFITSKLWNTKHHFEDVEPTCRKTLSDLGLDYLDLYLIHWPHAYKRGDVDFPKNPDKTPAFDTEIPPNITWHAMEKLVEKGLVKSIGVSNFNKEQIADILDKKMTVPANNQVECHPYFNQQDLLNYCKSKNISLTAYSPLGSPGRPFNLSKTGGKGLLGEPRIIEIASNHKKTVAQILIRYQIQRGVIVIPKSVKAPRIDENSQVFDFELTPSEMDEIDGLNVGEKGRLIYVEADKSHPHFPFSL